MMLRLAGFILVTVGGAAVGFGAASSVRGKAACWRGLGQALEILRSEIEFSLAPLSVAAAKAAAGTSGAVSDLFSTFSAAIDACPGVPAAVHMRRILRGYSASIPQQAQSLLTELSVLLGERDILGQVRAMELASRRVESALLEIERGKKERCRSYETLGLCTGLAMAVILL